MPFSAKAVELLEIAYLAQEDFMALIRGYPEDYEKFSLLRENLRFNRFYKKVVDVCSICSYNH
jgi:hypothetical protein